MSLGRSLLLVVLALVATSTVRAAPPVSVPAALSACEGLPPGFRSGAGVRRLDDAGRAEEGHAYHLVGAKQRFLVFTGTDDEPSCAVYPVGRALARVEGRFWPGAARVKAFLLTPPDCSKESCRPALAIRELGGEERVLAAIRPPLGCDADGTLEVFRAFEDRDSVFVECRGEAGAEAYNHAGALVHALGGGLTVVFEGSMGFSSGSSPNEDEERGEHCVWGPDAALRPVKRGPAPVLEHFDGEPRDEDPADEAKRIGTLTTWSFDTAAGRFRKTGERRESFTPAERCRPARGGGR